MSIALEMAGIWQQLRRGALGSAWIFSALANGLTLFVVGRLLMLGYREHAHLYQLGDRTRALETWIKALLPLARKLEMPRYRAVVMRNLSRAANRKGWDSDHFIASQMIWGMAAGLVALLFHLTLGLGLAFVLAATSIGVALPFLKLNDLATSRYQSCNRDLPYFIDYLNLAMGAGLDFNQALATVVADAPVTPLTGEFATVLRNIRLGMSRADALLEMERRLDSPALKLFVQTMVQAMALGSDVSVTLKVMAETLQQKRFQRAEELAGKISVRMMIPMMGFVLPSVMIILLGPMLLNSPFFD